MTDITVTGMGSSGIPPLNIDISGYENILDNFRSIGSRFDYNMNTEVTPQSPQSPSQTKEEQKEEDLPILPVLLGLILAGGAVVMLKK